VIAQFRTAIGTLGWSDGLLYGMSRVLERVTNSRCRMVKYHFVAQPVPERPLLSAAPRGTTVLVDRVELDDPIVQRFPRPADVIVRRFEAGAVCFVARTAACDPAGFIWIKLNDYMEDEVRCLYALDRRSAWDFDVWVAPEHRLTRTFARLWDAANRFLREQGYSWSLSRISAFNPASMAAHRRLGVQRLHSAVFLSAGPLQLALLSCRPYVHFALTRSQYPVVSLRGPQAESGRIQEPHRVVEPMKKASARFDGGASRGPLQ
jgi:hypothetical protein